MPLKLFTDEYQRMALYQALFSLQKTNCDRFPQGRVQEALAKLTGGTTATAMTKEMFTKLDLEHCGQLSFSQMQAYYTSLAAAVSKKHIQHIDGLIAKEFRLFAQPPASEPSSTFSTLSLTTNNSTTSIITSPEIKSDMILLTDVPALCACLGRALSPLEAGQAMEELASVSAHAGDTSSPASVLRSLSLRDFTAWFRRGLTVGADAIESQAGVSPLRRVQLSALALLARTHAWINNVRAEQQNRDTANSKSAFIVASAGVLPMQNSAQAALSFSFEAKHELDDASLARIEAMSAGAPLCLITLDLTLIGAADNAQCNQSGQDPARLDQQRALEPILKQISALVRALDMGCVIHFSFPELKPGMLRATLAWAGVLASREAATALPSPSLEQQTAINNAFIDELAAVLRHVAVSVEVAGTLRDIADKWAELTPSDLLRVRVSVDAHALHPALVQAAVSRLAQSLRAAGAGECKLPQLDALLAGQRGEMLDLDLSTLLLRYAQNVGQLLLAGSSLTAHSDSLATGKADLAKGASPSTLLEVPLCDVVKQLAFGSQLPRVSPDALYFHPEMPALVEALKLVLRLLARDVSKVSALHVRERGGSGFSVQLGAMCELSALCELLDLALPDSPVRVCASCQAKFLLSALQLCARCGQQALCSECYEAVYPAQGTARVNTSSRTHSALANAGPRSSDSDAVTELVAPGLAPTPPSTTLGSAPGYPLC